MPVEDQVVGGYRWNGTEWVPVEDQVVDGYRWNGTEWVPVEDRIVDGYQWNGTEWVLIQGEAVGDGSGVPIATTGASGEALSALPQAGRTRHRRVGWTIAAAALVLVSAVAIVAGQARPTPGSTPSSSGPVPAAPASSAPAPSSPAESESWPTATPSAAKGSKPEKVTIVRVERDDFLGEAVGDCLTGDRTKVPCSSPHSQEVFAIARITTRKLPGEAALERAADDFCAAGIRRYLKNSRATMPDQWSVSWPNVESWPYGHKTITCAAEDDPPLPGSIRDR